MGGSRGRGLRPSQVLPLPDRGRGWAPPRPDPLPPSRRGTGRRTARTVVAGALVLVALAVVGSALLADPGPVTPDLVTDVVTEDAVVTVLQLYAAEVALPDAVQHTGDVFALPGPAARAVALDHAVERARAMLAATREAAVGPGTPAESYAAHSDHDVLLQVAADVVAHTADLAALGEVHATLLTGAATVTPEQARADVARVAGRDQPQLRAWAQALQQLLDGAVDPAAAQTARDVAGREWQAAADRLAPAALEDLTAFLNGIDPGVLAALDGHPVAGPALRRLRA